MPIWLYPNSNLSPIIGLSLSKKPGEIMILVNKMPYKLNL